MDRLPSFQLPEGYSYRFYRTEDKRHWADIECKAGEFSDRETALKQFKSEFGSFENEMKRRCIFLIPDGIKRPVGTATAWYGCRNGKLWGRLHWVGIVPEHQGKNLGRPLVGTAMKRLADLKHDRVYLTTQTTSLAAIKIYLDFGFVPYIRSGRCRKGWDIVEAALNYPIPGK